MERSIATYFFSFDVKINAIFNHLPSPSPNIFFIILTYGAERFSWNIIKEMAHKNSSQRHYPGFIMTLKMQLLKFVFGILLNAKHQEQVVEKHGFLSDI